MALSGSGEFAVLARLRGRFEQAGYTGTGTGGAPPGETWIGDDAAVVHGRDPLTLLATDLVVDGVHVDLNWCSLADVGYKAVMVAVSDLAAMGARPDHVLLSMAVPRDLDPDGIAEGVAEAVGEVGAVVVGGDLSGAPCLMVSVAVSGSLHGGSHRAPLLRSGAKPGDLLFVTGPLGASSAGLRLLRRGGHRDAPRPGFEALASAHRRPRARLDEGEAAREAAATAAIDVSDGLVADALHLATASGVGLVLDQPPIATGAVATDAETGGEDYELVIATGDADRLAEAFARRGLRPPIPIGRCTEHPGRYTLGGRPLAGPGGGWEHRFAPGVSLGERGTHPGRAPDRGLSAKPKE